MRASRTCGVQRRKGGRVDGGTVVGKKGGAVKKIFTERKEKRNPSKHDGMAARKRNSRKKSS